jgi:class 3 adenylate cyclase
LFCDVVGYTSRSEHADPEDVRARMRTYYQRLREEIEGYGGTVEKFIGDAVMAVFGPPVVHEDDTIVQAVRALSSALTARRRSSRPTLRPAANRLGRAVYSATRQMSCTAVVHARSRWSPSGRSTRGSRRSYEAIAPRSEVAARIPTARSIASRVAVIGSRVLKVASSLYQERHRTNFM